MNTAANVFDFDTTSIPGDGTCFYHMLSVAMSGKVDGAAIRADVHTRWNNMTDIYRHIHSEFAFNRYLVNYVTCHLGKARDDVWKLLCTNKAELFRLAGEYMFAGNTYADEFAINITSMLYGVEVNVLVVTEQPSGNLVVSDTRKFPYDQTTDETFGNFKNWSATRSVATALYNQCFYVKSDRNANARYPNHFTNIYHVTKTYADVLSGRADVATHVATKVPGGWDALLEGARQSLLKWISRRYVHYLCILIVSPIYINRVFAFFFYYSKIMEQSYENERLIKTAMYVIYIYI